MQPSYGKKVSVLCEAEACNSDMNVCHQWKPRAGMMGRVISMLYQSLGVKTIKK